MTSRRRFEFKSHPSSKTGNLLPGPMQARSPSEDSSDEDIVGRDAVGLVNWRGLINRVLIDRYKIVDKAGQGTFGTVVNASDMKYNGEPCAIKIVRAVPRYTEAARIEVAVLQKILASDPTHVWSVNPPKSF